MNDLNVSNAKKMLLVLSASAMLVASAPYFVAPDASAASVIPAASKAEIKSMTPVSVTHDEITLTLSNLKFDNNKLTFELQREGKGMPENMLGNPKDRGYLQSPQLLVDGEQIKAPGMFGDTISSDRTLKKKSATAQYKAASLPDEFELTVRVHVSQVKEPFEFKLPVKKEASIAVVKPNQTKSSNGFTYKVTELSATKDSTRLVLHSEGKVPASSKQKGQYAPTMMYYDIVDDQGRSLEQQMLGFYNKAPETKYNLDELYSALDPNTKYVVIKPYTFTVKTSDWSIVGEKVDKKGKILSYGTKTYLKDLEMKIELDNKE